MTKVSDAPTYRFVYQLIMVIGTTKMKGDF